MDALIFDGDGVWQSPPEIGGLPREALTAGQDVDTSRVELLLGEDARVIGRARLRGGEARIAVDPVIAFDEVTDARLSVRVRSAGWTFEVPLCASATMSGRRSLEGTTCRIEVGDDGAVRVLPARANRRWSAVTARGLRGARRIAGRILPARVKRLLADKLL